jgi:glutathione peroxidase
MNIYDYEVKDNKGNNVKLETFRGKVLLIVNTATGCGFTPQYEGLQTLYEKYSEQGFEILDFPCNQFANQAPGTEKEIENFCQLRYGVTFTMFAKVNVNGEKAEPLFTYLKSQQKGVMGSSIKWNFTKFLVNREGKVIERFAPTVAPEKIDKKIKDLL